MFILSFVSLQTSYTIVVLWYNSQQSAADISGWAVLTHRKHTQIDAIKDRQQYKVTVGEQRLAVSK